MSIFLVCEGTADGLDVRVLDLIVAQKLNREIHIIPAGGERGLGSVASWLEERSRKPLPDGTMGSPRDRAYAIEDRDFCSLEEVERIWQRPDQKRWIWRRHEIENYLLDPRLIVDAFDALKAAHVRGADVLPGDLDVVRLVLQEIAQPMLEDHAGWLTYWHLVSHKRATADTRLLWPDSPLPPSLGSPYPGRVEWLDYLRSECTRMRESCKQLAGDVAFDEPAIVEAYDHVLLQITRPDFLASGRTIHALVHLVADAGATLVGIGAVIEKRFEGGREVLGYLDVPIEALAVVTDMSDGRIVFEGDQ